MGLLGFLAGRHHFLRTQSDSSSAKEPFRMPLYLYAYASQRATQQRRRGLAEPIDFLSAHLPITRLVRSQKMRPRQHFPSRESFIIPKSQKSKLLQPAVAFIYPALHVYHISQIIIVTLSQVSCLPRRRQAIFSFLGCWIRASMTARTALLQTRKSGSLFDRPAM